MRRQPRTPGATGRFLLRMPPALHAALTAAARAAGLSLNEYCVRILAAPGPSAAAHPGASAVVQHAAAVAGTALLGVAVYGSWARGEAGPASDVDALIVVQPTLPLTRTLYRQWDARPVTWDDRPVDPHFVHPRGHDASGGVWPEVALQGIVLFEHGGALTAALLRVRQEIADGRLVRRHAHGQPYWTAA